MTFAEALQNSVIILVPLIQFAICALMLRRGMACTFPVFFIYITYKLLHGLATTVAMHLSYVAYFWIYWIGEGVDALFILAVIQEIFAVVFAPYDSLRKFGSLIFRSMTIILCFVAIITALLAPAAETNPMMKALFVMDRSVQIVQLGLLIFLFAFCALFGLTWRHYVFGIAAGFVVMTSISTVVLSLRTNEGQAGNFWFNVFGPLGFSLGNLTWACYFASAKALVPLNVVPGTEQLVAWNQALSRLGHSKTRPDPTL